MLPIERPGKIVCVGLNYHAHAEEQGRPVPDHPILFAKWPTSLVGPGDPILLPPPEVTRAVDAEAELGVVIGSRVKAVSAENALEAVRGYLCANDVSARDVQRADRQFTRAKSFDTFCPVGPELVPAAEVPDPQALTIRGLVNGEVRQESHSGRMSVTIPEILSNFSALGYSPGDVLSTGTVSGVAGFKSPEERARLYLKPGDVIEAEIERIGVLRNPVVSWQEAHGEPAPPRIRPWGDA